MAAAGGYVKRNVNSNRGRLYVLMLLLAFGAAMSGVMLLHKLRERRNFTVMLKERDHDLFSLQLLLQQERNSAKEAKEKFDKMRTTIYSLRTHKMELDNRVMEMQSTIASLKDEQRTMESELEEKENEIKALREKEASVDKKHSHAIAMTEMLRQKEAEIQDLKQPLEYPVKVWSVSNDDPSELPVKNFIVGDMKDRDDSNTINEKKENGENDVKATEEIADQNQSTDQSEGESSFGSQNRADQGTNQDENLQQKQQQIYTKDSSAKGGMEGEKSVGEDTDSKANNGFATYGRLGYLHASLESKVQEAEGGVKLEVPETAGNGLDSGMRRKHGHAKKMKGKRARLMGKLKGLRHNKNAENNGASTMAISEDRPEKELYNGTRFSDENGNIETVKNSETSEDLLRKTGNQDAMMVSGEASEMLISTKERSEKVGSTAKDNDEATSEGASFQKSQNVEDDENQKNKTVNVESKQDMEMKQANNLGDHNMKMKQVNVLEDSSTVKVNDEATSEGASFQKSQNVEEDENQKNKTVNVESKQDMEMQQANNLAARNMKMKQVNDLEDSDTVKVNDEATWEGTNMLQSQNVEDDENQKNKVLNAEKGQDMEMKQANVLEDGSTAEVNDEATLKGANMQKSQNDKDDEHHQNKMMNAERKQVVEMKQGIALEDGGTEKFNNKATLEGAKLQKPENQKDQIGSAETYQDAELKQGKVLEDGTMGNSNPSLEEPLTNKSDHDKEPNREVRVSDVQEDTGSQVETSEETSRAKDAEQAKDEEEHEKKVGSDAAQAKDDTEEKEGSEAAEVHEFGLNQTQHETINKLRSKMGEDNKESKGENEEENKEETEEPAF